MKMILPNTKKHSGAALILAMLIFSVSAALLVVTQKSYSIFFQKMANSIIREQAYEYLLGAEELAVLALMLDARKDSTLEQPRDDLREFWAQATMPFTLDEGGVLFGSIEDLSGRFNLNHLAHNSITEAGAKKFSSPQEQFIRLIQCVTSPSLSVSQAIEVTEAIGDWIDFDKEPRSGGAEDMWYGGQQLPYRAANRSMASISELRLVRHITPQIYEQLLPLVTVWPRKPGLMNIHTIAQPLFRTFNEDGDLTPLSEEDARILITERQDVGFNDVDSMLENPIFQGKTLTELKSFLGTSTRYFRFSGNVELEGLEMDLHSILERSGQRVGTLARSSIPL